VRHAHDDRSPIPEEVVDAVRNGNPAGVGAEVLVVDEAGLALPARTGILEETDQLSLLGVDTDDGLVSAVKAAAQVQAPVAVRIFTSRPPRAG
jgi:hypothetical protein